MLDIVSFLLKEKLIGLLIAPYDLIRIGTLITAVIKYGQDGGVDDWSGTVGVVVVMVVLQWWWWCV